MKYEGKINGKTVLFYGKYYTNQTACQMVMPCNYCSHNLEKYIHPKLVSFFSFAHENVCITNSYLMWDTKLFNRYIT